MIQSPRYSVVNPGVAFGLGGGGVSQAKRPTSVEGTVYKEQERRHKNGGEKRGPKIGRPLGAGGWESRGRAPWPARAREGAGGDYPRHQSADIVCADPAYAVYSTSRSVQLIREI